MRFPSYLTGEPLPVLKKSRLNLGPLTEMYLKTSLKRAAGGTGKSSGKSNSSDEDAPKGLLGRMESWSQKKSEGDALLRQAVQATGGHTELLQTNPYFKQAFANYNEISDPITANIMERETKIVDEWKTMLDKKKTGGQFNIDAWVSGKGLGTNWQWVNRIENASDFKPYENFNFSQEMINEEDGMKELQTIYKTIGATQGGVGPREFASIMATSIGGDFTVPGIAKQVSGVDGNKWSTNAKQRAAIMSAYSPSKAMRNMLHNNFLNVASANGYLDRMEGTMLDDGTVIKDGNYRKDKTGNVPKDVAFVDRDGNPNQNYFMALSDDIEKRLVKVNEAQDENSYFVEPAKQDVSFTEFKDDGSGMAQWKMSELIKNVEMVPVEATNTFDYNRSLEQAQKKLTQVLADPEIRKNNLSINFWGPTQGETMDAYVSRLLKHGTVEELGKLGKAIGMDLVTIRKAGSTKGVLGEVTNPDALNWTMDSGMQWMDVMRERWGIPKGKDVEVGISTIGSNAMIYVGNTYIPAPTTGTVNFQPTVIEGIPNARRGPSGQYLGTYSAEEVRDNQRRLEMLYARIDQGDAEAINELNAWMKTDRYDSAARLQTATFKMTAEEANDWLKKNQFNVATGYQPTKLEVQSVTSGQLENYAKEKGLRKIRQSGQLVDDQLSFIIMYADENNETYSEDQVKSDYLFNKRYQGVDASGQKVMPVVPKSIAGGDVVEIKTYDDKGNEITVELKGLDKKLYEQAVGNNLTVGMENGQAFVYFNGGVVINEMFRDESGAKLEQAVQRNAIKAAKLAQAKAAGVPVVGAVQQNVINNY